MLNTGAGPCLHVLGLNGSGGERLHKTTDSGFRKDKCENILNVYEPVILLDTALRRRGSHRAAFSPNSI